MAVPALAKEPGNWAQLAQNPMADVMKLPVVNQFNQGVGHKEGTEYILSFKPSMVSDLSNDWNLVNRFDVPFIYQPGLAPGNSDAHGLGDIRYESFYGPSGERTFYWGIGPLLEIPSATDNTFSTKKWSTGLGGTGTVAKGPFVIGARANHLWSFAGDGNEPDVNRSTIEYFAYCNLGRGWSLGTSPINIANWEAPQDETWTIPIGGGIGKVLMNGRQPINLKLEAYHYAEQPATGAEWQLLFEIQFLFNEEILFKN
ncbi:MAG: neuromedin U [Verrucomicrobiota bacterium]|nr:neuromedin U [Verrucomicrobiota bacterium]